MESTIKSKPYTEQIKATLTDFISDIYLCQVDGITLIAHNQGHCLKYESLDELAVKARHLLNVIAAIKAEFDTGEFNRWIEAINEERAQLYLNEQAAWLRDQKKKRSKAKATKIYLMRNERSGHYKIGRAQNPAYRERTLQADEPEVRLVTAYAGFAVDERRIHELFNEKRLRGEWFALTDSDVQQFHDYFK